MNQRKGRTGFILAFLAPATILYATFVVWPMIQSFVLSLYRWRGVSQSKTFVGTDNFHKLFQDGAFWQSLEHNLELLVGVGLAALVVGLVVAHWMQSSGRMSKVLRSVYLFPQAISLVVVSVLWMFMYNPSFGLVSAGLKAAGLERLDHVWLAESGTALPSVGTALLWYIAGFYIMLFATGIRAIPREVNEAVTLEGAHGWSRFAHITWPMLWSIKRIALVYVVINVMNVFALVYLMTQGGPDRKTEVMLTYLYEQAFTNSQFGYATALAVVNFIVALGLSGLLLFLFRRNPEAPNT